DEPRARRPRRLSAIAVAIVLVGLAGYLRLTPANYVVGGQDQGVYANVANHLAATGRVTVSDPLPDVLRPNDALEDYYQRNTYSGLGERDAIPWAREFLPGLYFHPTKPDAFVPQFYHLHPLWMAVSVSLFGQQAGGWAVWLAGMLVVGLCFFLARDLTGSVMAGSIAAALAAASPALSYLAKFPVSESLTAFFFLLGCWGFLRSEGHRGSWLLLSSLAFWCFFLTHISGFVLLAFLLLTIGGSVVFDADARTARRLVLYGVFVVLGYLWSFLHGLAFSYPYSRHIYYANLGWASEPARLAAGVVCAAVTGLVLSFALRRWSEPLLARFRTERAAAVAATAAVILLATGTVYRGWQLGFSERFVGDPWIDAKWHVADRGIESLYRFSPWVLATLLTWPGMVAAIVGLWVTVRRGYGSLAARIVAICSIGYYAVFAFQKFVVPYFYFYVRYLAAELLPLFVVLAAVGVWHLVTRMPRRARRTAVGVFVAIVGGGGLIGS
ncbi:MAG: hypothetical protein KDD44_11595, partial [Bdellovibrionales bacterium]|nr:hypothetical protein [Bdellovibrionales bacterium]